MKGNKTSVGRIAPTGKGSEIPNSRCRKFRTNTAFGMLGVCVVRACLKESGYEGLLKQRATKRRIFRNICFPEYKIMEEN